VTDELVRERRGDILVARLNRSDAGSPPVWRGR
jgi:hypothetical protein